MNSLPESPAEFPREPLAFYNLSLVSRRSIPAWLLSFALHTLLLVAMLFLLQQFSRGAADVENRTGGIVLVDAQSESTEYLSEGEVEQTSSESKQHQSPPPLPTDAELPPDLPGMAVNSTPITGVGDDFSDALSGADSMLDGPSSNRPTGGKITTEVFGVKGTGSRFVYVFDRSASMEGFEGRPLRAAKKQLLQSLESLGETHQFQIVFYNDQTKTFSPDPGPVHLVLASEKNKQKATRFVESIRGESGTNHMDALKTALLFGPDVVFLLTDAEGGFTASELSTVGSWNRSGAIINSIEFGVGSRGSSDRSLEQLSRLSGGQYIYKNVQTFRD